MAPSPAPHERSSYVDIAPSAPSNSPPAQRTSASATPNQSAHRASSGSPKATPVGKSSPTTYVFEFSESLYTRQGRSLIFQSHQVSKWRSTENNCKKRTWRGTFARAPNLTSQTAQARSFQKHICESRQLKAFSWRIDIERNRE